MNYLKKTAVATAIAGALGTGATVADDGVWFPYVSQGDTWTTIISVINASPMLFNNAGIPGYNSLAAAGFDNMHWVYQHKSSDTIDGDFGDNAAPCIHSNRLLPTSKDDLQTVDLGSQGSTQWGDDAGSMFGDPTAPKNAGDPGFKSFRIMKSKGKFSRGHLLVHNADTGTTLASDIIPLELTSLSSEHATVSGEFLSLDYSLGAAVGGQGIQLDDIGEFPDFDDNDMRKDLLRKAVSIWTANYTEDVEDYMESWYDDRDMVQRLPWMPPDEVYTNLLVTPVQTPMIHKVEDGQDTMTWEHDTMFGLDGNKLAIKVGLSTLDERPDDQITGTAFNRDEVIIESANKKELVVCVGKVNIQTLLRDTDPSDYVYPDGGWAYLHAYWAGDDGVHPVHGAHVYKHELSVGSTFDGHGTNGVWNNMYDMIEFPRYWFREGVMRDLISYFGDYEKPDS